jgi:TPR repeat protein
MSTKWALLKAIPQEPADNPLSCYAMADLLEEGGWLDLAFTYRWMGWYTHRPGKREGQRLRKRFVWYKVGAFGGWPSDEAERYSSLPHAWLDPLVYQALQTANPYLGGEGVEKQDDKEALGWIQKAADQAFAPAQSTLGVIYALGIGVRAKNEAAGARWMRKAADQGHADAQYNLGSMHEAGQGVPPDLNEARRWYQKAADQGHTKAKQRLEKLK